MLELCIGSVLKQRVARISEELGTGGSFWLYASGHGCALMADCLLEF